MTDIQSHMANIMSDVIHDKSAEKYIKCCEDYSFYIDEDSILFNHANNLSKSPYIKSCDVIDSSGSFKIEDDYGKFVILNSYDTVKENIDDFYVVSFSEKNIRLVHKTTDITTIRIGGHSLDIDKLGGKRASSFDYRSGVLSVKYDGGMENIKLESLAMKNNSRSNMDYELFSKALHDEILSLNIHDRIEVVNIGRHDTFSNIIVYLKEEMYNNLDVMITELKKYEHFIEYKKV